MQAFTRSDFYKGLLAHVLGGIPDTLFKRCPTLVSTGSQITLLESVIFAADGYPKSGRWKQSFPVSGCEGDKVLNLYFTAGADEKINTIVANPGTTRADLTLQRDALLYANMEATLAEKSCKSFVVNNTRFDAVDTSSPPVPGVDPSHHLWSETRTMVGCGHAIDVPMKFIPDKIGTVISSGKGIEH